MISKMLKGRQETVAEYGNSMYEAIQRGRPRKKAAGKARESEESAERS
jgi:hypothetical protein